MKQSYSTILCEEWKEKHTSKFDQQKYLKNYVNFKELKRYIIAVFLFNFSSKVQN